MRLITFPVMFTVSIFTALLTLVYRFLLSAWGLLTPLTFIVLAAAFQYIQQIPQQLADHYASQFDTCGEADIPKFINALNKLGDTGIDGLVQGMCCHRETVLNGCLQQITADAQTAPLATSAALLKHCQRMTPAAQYETVKLAQEMLKERDRTSRQTEYSVEHISNCEKLLTTLSAAQRRITEPNSGGNAEPSATAASLTRRIVQPQLIAANGKPFENERIKTGFYSGTRLAVNNTEPIPPSSFPPSATAVPEEKIASQYNIPERNTVLMPAEDIPLDKIPSMPPVQLMQLLHHPNPDIVQAVQKTLVERDGFQEPHLKLAWRLYHPVASVRQEILDILPLTANIQPAGWLSELLNDSNSDIRYRAASFLATSRDPAMQQLLVEKAKHDTDERLIQLADKVMEQQRVIRR